MKLNKINNVHFTGRYKSSEVMELFNKADIINVVFPIEGKNSTTLLPNRLYTAVLLGKLVVTMRGNYLSEVVSEYNLGIVLDSYNNIDYQITQYLNNFNIQNYLYRRSEFLNYLKSDNEKFKSEILAFTKYTDYPIRR